MIVSHFNIEHDAYLKTTNVYKLLVTNLSDDYYDFELRLRSANHDLYRYAAVDIDLFGQDASLLSALIKTGPESYRTEYSIPIGAQDTVQIRLFPDYVRRSDTSVPDMRAFGYAELVIPTIWQNFDKTREAQGVKPVPVLLSPSVITYDNATGQHEETPIPLSTGQAKNEITPEQPIRSRFIEQSLGVLKAFGKTNARRIQNTLADEQLAASTLLSLLADISQESDSITALNRLLSEAEIPVSLSQQGAKSLPANAA